MNLGLNFDFEFKSFPGILIKQSLVYHMERNNKFLNTSEAI
jgi:hypothetical protein